MQMRHVYVILAGCMTTAALVGWMRPVLPGGLTYPASSSDAERIAPPSSVQATEQATEPAEAPEKPKPAVVPCEDGSVPSEAVGADGAPHLETIVRLHPLSLLEPPDAVSAEPAIHLVSPDVVPDIAPRPAPPKTASPVDPKQLLEQILADATFKESPLFGKASSAAIVDPDTKHTLALHGDLSFADQMVAALQAAPASGHRTINIGSKSESLYWSCENAHLCLAVAVPLCPAEGPSAVPKFTAEPGSVITPLPPAPADSAPGEEKTNLVSVLVPWLISFSAGLLMILLGLAWTRPRKHSIPNESREELAKLRQGKQENEKALLRMRHRVEELEAGSNRSRQEQEELRSENSQLRNQLDYAKQSYRESSQTIQKLEEEKQSLMDKLDDIPMITDVQTLDDEDEDRTGKQKPPSAPTRPIPTIETTPESPAAPRKPATTAKVDAVEHDSLSSIFGDNDGDLFSDDGWDELTASFDAITAGRNSTKKLGQTPSDSGMISMKPIQNDNAPSKTPRSQTQIDDFSGFGFLDDDKADSSVAGMLEFLNGSKASDHVPLLETSSLADSDLRTKPAPSTTSGTLNGTKPISVKFDDSSHGNASKQTSSFKPSPSWTGRKSIDTRPTDRETGLSAAALVEAVTRRAKDISEMNTSVTRDGSSDGLSGALDFNRAISKSGVFSVTGSRASINLKSDPEYFKELYAEYSSMQRVNGEPQKFTCEQFVTHMANQKAQLIKKLNCKSVKFTIYTKDGKTSIKANAIR